MAKLKVFFVCLYTMGIPLGYVEGLQTVTLLPTLCGQTSMGESCQIILAHVGVEVGVSMYTDPVPDCQYTLMAASDDQRIRFSIGTGQDEVNAIVHDQGCAGAALEVFDTDGTTMLAMLCDGVIDRTEYLSTGNEMTLNLRSTGGNGTVLNFTAQYTSFSEAANCGSDPSFFPCANGRCVDPAGQCDATLINNCGDFSDNSRGPPGNCSSEDMTTTATTVPATTIAITTTTTSTAGEESESLIWIAGAAVGGVLGAYFLYWLLWRPGYLVWRCSCWRHWCRSPGTEAKTADGLLNNTKSKGGPNPSFPTANGPSDFPPGYPSGGGGGDGIYGITREAHIFK